MDNEIKLYLKMKWIYFLLCMLDVTAAANFTIYHNENLLDDMLCLSSAAKLAGKFSEMSFCAHACTQADGCLSLFYSSAERACYSVDSVLTSTSGCLSRPGNKYFIKQVCQPPGAPEYGSVVYSYGRTVCSFSCSLGYILNGPASIQCVDGAWNGPPTTCEDVDECLSSPCKNGAICNDLINRYTCDCMPGYAGIICDIDINECASSPCQNGATCADLINAYSCTCVDGFTAQNCDQAFKGFRGACNNGVDFYSCSCPATYMGTNCQLDVNECLNSPCQNGGACSNSFGSYSCTCVAGFGGTNCQNNINECSSSPCLNGGNCIDLVNGYTCSCTSVYTGTHCEQDCYSGTGGNYYGTRDRTVGGILCQRWDSQYPHGHPHTDLYYFPDSTLSQAKNYCRNPEAENHPPWCMTTDPYKQWDYCGIIQC